MTPDRAVLDDAEQNARCRTLELMVLLRALLDATWDERAFRAARPNNTPMDDSVAHTMRQYCAAARRWLLAPANREQVEAIADNAGLMDGYIWEIVRRFVVEREDPRPLRILYKAIGDHPGRRNFDLSVAFVP